MTRKKFFLMKRVQNLYLGKVSEWRFLNPIGFCRRTKKWEGGVNFTPLTGIGLRVGRIVNLKGELKDGKFKRGVDCAAVPK